MKINEKQLRQVIKESIKKALNEDIENQEGTLENKEEHEPTHYERCKNCLEQVLDKLYKYRKIIENGGDMAQAKEYLEYAHIQASYALRYLGEVEPNW